MAEAITVFDIKLGNCGTSELFSVTLDNDCIVIKGKNTRKVVLKKAEGNIEVRFFIKKGNTYYKKFNLGDADIDTEPKSRSLLNVAAFLFNNSNISNLNIFLNLAVATQFQQKPFIINLAELGADTIQLFDAISNYINVNNLDFPFTEKVNSEKLQETVDLFNTNLESSKLNLGIDVNSVSQLPSTVGGSHKRYRKSRKYRKQQSRKQSRRHFQRRKKTHRRKSRTSRRSRK